MTDNISGIDPNAGDRSLSETDLETLRRLLLGAQYQAVLEKIKILDDPILLGPLIAPAIDEALKLKASANNLQRTLTPTIVSALMDSVSDNPKPVADALYPAMGPAIRKSISSTMDQMTRNFTQLLAQSVSPKAWRWRFDAWRTGRSYAEVVLIKSLVFQVEQVFLIHRETGLLLQHVLADTAISKDPDLVSGMLTAIQDFTSDSFSVEQNSGLNSLKLGDLTVLIENGPHAVLAVVIRGTVPTDMQELLAETIEEVHLQEHRKLSNYKGDPSGFIHLQPLLSKCLKIQLINSDNKTDTKEKLKKNKALEVGICFALLLASWLIYSHHQSTAEQKEWERLQQIFQSEPGVIITNAAYKNGQYHISGLADPLAKKPSLLINHGTLNDIKVVLAFKPYLSLETDIVLRRIRNKFDIPDSVKLDLNNEILSLLGRSTRAWLQQFETDVSKFSGIKSLDINKLNIAE